MTNRKYGCLALALLAGLILAGCAGSGDSSDDDRRGGFYAGVEAGMTVAR